MFNSLHSIIYLLVIYLFNSDFVVLLPNIANSMYALELVCATLPAAFQCHTLYTQIVRAK
jgi:hypothetical protein